MRRSSTGTSDSNATSTETFPESQHDTFSEDQLRDWQCGHSSTNDPAEWHPGQSVSDADVKQSPRRAALRNTMRSPLHERDCRCRRPHSLQTGHRGIIELTNWSDNLQIEFEWTAEWARDANRRYQMNLRWGRELTKQNTTRNISNELEMWQLLAKQRWQLKISNELEVRRELTKQNTTLNISNALEMGARTDKAEMTTEDIKWTWDEARTDKAKHDTEYINGTWDVASTDKARDDNWRYQMNLRWGENWLSNTRHGICQWNLRCG